MIRNPPAGFAASLLAVTLLLGLLAGRSAQAQSADQTPMTVPEIQQCLCQQPTLQPLQDAWLARQRDFDEHQRQLATVDQQIVAQRQKLDPADVVGQQVLKDLMAQQQELRDTMQSRFLPAVTQARDSYNAAVARYNGVCTRPRYAVDEAKARQNLACPLP